MTIARTHDGERGTRGGLHEPKGDGRPIADSVDAIKEDLADLARDVGAGARSGVADMRARARRSFESARDTGAEATESLRSAIASRPVTSVAIALGAGIVLGLTALARKKSPAGEAPRRRRLRRV